MDQNGVSSIDMHLLLLKYISKNLLFICHSTSVKVNQRQAISVALLKKTD